VLFHPFSDHEEVFIVILVVTQLCFGELFLHLRYTFDMVHMNVGSKYVFKLEVILADVSDERVDGAADVYESRFFAFSINQEITISLDRTGDLVKDDDLTRPSARNCEK
jgi:hypothetical protein